MSESLLIRILWQILSKDLLMPVYTTPLVKPCDRVEIKRLKWRVSSLQIMDTNGFPNIGKNDGNTSIIFNNIS